MVILKFRFRSSGPPTLQKTHSIKVTSRLKLPIKESSQSTIKNIRIAGKDRSTQRSVARISRSFLGHNPRSFILHSRSVTDSREKPSPCCHEYARSGVSTSWYKVKYHFLTILLPSGVVILLYVSTSRHAINMFDVLHVSQVTVQVGSATMHQFMNCVKTWWSQQQHHQETVRMARHE